jgi:hypothetical protein
MTLSNYNAKHHEQPLVIIQYDYQRMFYDRSCSFTAYQVSNFKDFILTAYEDRYKDYPREVLKFRSFLLNIYETEGEDAAINAMEQAENISCEKLKCFRGTGVMDVLNFMENYH